MVECGGFLFPVGSVPHQTGDIARCDAPFGPEFRCEKTAVPGYIHNEIKNFVRSPRGFGTKRIIIVTERRNVRVRFIPEFGFTHPQTASLYAGGRGEGSDR